MINYKCVSGKLVSFKLKSTIKYRHKKSTDNLILTKA